MYSQIHITFLDYERKVRMYLCVCLGRGGFGLERGRKRTLAKIALDKTGIFEVERLIRVQHTTHLFLSLLLSNVLFTLPQPHTKLNLVVHA